MIVVQWFTALTTFAGYEIDLLLKKAQLFQFAIAFRDSRIFLNQSGVGRGI